MVKALLKSQILSTNYVVFHDLLGVIPTLPSQKKMRAYKLHDLQYSPNQTDPTAHPKKAAKALVNAYHAGGYLVKDPRGMLVEAAANPADARTMDDLTMFVKANHMPRFDTALGTFPKPTGE